MRNHRLSFSSVASVLSVAFALGLSGCSANFGDTTNTSTQTAVHIKGVVHGGQQPLNGAHVYTVTFPAGQTPPVDGFWSLTLYNKEHLFEPNKLNRFSLGTKSKAMKQNPDGSLTAARSDIYYGQIQNFVPFTGGHQGQASL